MIYLPKIYGTCKGASRSVDLSMDLAKKTKDVYMYKEILHNKDVIDYLLSSGVKYTEDIKDVKAGNTVIIRAHGETKELFEYLDKKKIKYLDTTCTNVIKIHNIIEKYYDDGYSIIIIGKNNHPEVIGSNGWCGNSAYICESVKDIDAIKKVNDKILVICQTTISDEMFNSITTALKEKFKDKNLEIMNTICGAQKAIQLSSVEACKKAKYTFVIGGEKSSNTRELFNVCSNYSKCFLISNKNKFLEVIKELKLDKVDVCFTAGASTPKSNVDEYINLYKFYTYYTNLRERLDKKIRVLNKDFLDKNDNTIIKDAVNKFGNLNSDGKYIRSFMIDLAYNLNSKTNSNYSDYLALSYETFETAILVHDDIIDNATTRRGKKTIPVTYMELFKNKNSKDLANSMGICLGNYGFYESLFVLSKQYGTNKNFSKIIEYYCSVVLSTIKGEIMDVYLPFKERYYNDNKIELDDILEIYRLKTSWYTIVGPFVLGLLLRGATSKEIKAFEEALMPLGIAFQIKDDLLGVFSDSNTIGKDTNDISEYKMTILYYYAFTSKYKSDLLKLYGKKKLSVKEINTVRQIFIDSGAYDKSVNYMNDLFKQTRDSIDKLTINKEYKDLFLGFINFLEIRNK